MRFAGACAPAGGRPKPPQRRTSLCKKNHTSNLEKAVQASIAERQASSNSVPELLTAKDLEALLKIDVKTIYAYVQKGLIPYVRIQSNVRFRRAEILDWIEKQSYRPQPANGNGKRRN